MVCSAAPPAGDSHSAGSSVRRPQSQELRCFKSSSLAEPSGLLDLLLPVTFGNGGVPFDPPW